MCAFLFSGLLAAALAVSVITAAAPGAAAIPPAGAVDRPGPIARGDDEDARPVVGWSPAELPDIDWLDRRERTLASLTGQVLVIRSFTDTCPFCAASMPALEKLHRDHAARGLSVLGVYHPKPPRAVAPSEVASFARSLGVTFPIGIDLGWRLVESWWLERTQSSWTSVTWVLDRKCVVRFVHPGGEYHAGGGSGHGRCRDDEREIRLVVERLLAESAPHGNAPSVVEAVEMALLEKMTGAFAPAIELRAGRSSDGTVYVRQFP